VYFQKRSAALVGAGGDVKVPSESQSPGGLIQEGQMKCRWVPVARGSSEVDGSLFSPHGADVGTMVFAASQKNRRASVRLEDVRPKQPCARLCEGDRAARGSTIESAGAIPGRMRSYVQTGPGWRRPRVAIGIAGDGGNELGRSATCFLKTLKG